VELGVFRILPSSSFKKLLKPPKLSPTTSPAPKTSKPPPIPSQNFQPKKCKAVPPTDLPPKSTKYAFEFPTSPSKKTKTVPAESKKLTNLKQSEAKPENEEERDKTLECFMREK
jgi:hypothetical protein